jgi:putative membrane protein
VTAAAVVVGVGFGAWLLVVWDLVLDPAMAHEALPVRYWVWHQTGPYFGMPLRNFLGWGGTALLFMGLSRALWRRDPSLERVPPWTPLTVYGANTAFAAVLSASVGLWVPVLLSLALGLLPILAGLRLPAGGPGRAGGRGPRHGERPPPAPPAGLRGAPARQP